MAVQIPQGKIAIVADNSAEWASFVTGRIRPLLPDGAAVVTITNPQQVVEVVTSCQSRDLIGLFMDFHFSSTGREDLPAILGAIHEKCGDLELPIVCLSGTHTDPVIAPLSKSGSQIPLAHKTSLVFGGTSCENFQRLAARVIAGELRTLVNQGELAAMQSVAPRATHISHVVDAVDRIRGHAALVLSNLATPSSCSEMAEAVQVVKSLFTQMPISVYDLHEFKNRLHLCVASISGSSTLTSSEADYVVQKLSSLCNIVTDEYRAIISARHSVDIHRLVRDLVQQTYSGQAGRITIVENIEALPPVLESTVASSDIRTMISNALQNALTYSPEASSVRIELNGIYISIENTIPPEHDVAPILGLQHQRTVRPEAGRSHSTGTGIAQIREILNRSNGEISAHAEAKHHRTTSTELDSTTLLLRFTFSAPRIAHESADDDETSGLIPRFEVRMCDTASAESTGAVAVKDLSPPAFRELSTIAILDHDGSRNAHCNFESLLPAIPETLNKEILCQRQVSWRWKLDDTDDADTENYIRQFIEHYAATLENTSVFVIHSHGAAFLKIATAIRERFPHIVLLPLSSFPAQYFGGMLSRDQQARFDELAVTLVELLDNAESPDTNNVLEQCSWDSIYSRTQSPELFAAVVNTSQKIAGLRLANRHGGSGESPKS